MLYLYQSNRLERLFDALCEVLHRPLSGPLVPETIIVQNPGTARWLSRQIALRNGVAANLDFPLPARFIWQILATQLQIPEDVQDFTRQKLHWRLFALLEESKTLPLFTELHKYLQDDGDGRKRYQLAGRIADAFDQYLVYRPDLISAWEAGGGEGWQPVFWRKLSEGSVRHRAGLFLDFLEHYRDSKLVRDSLPERIVVFGASSMAPAYLEVLQAVATTTDVHFFHLSPCRAFWSDLVSDRDLARQRSAWRRRNLPDVSEYYHSGNSLLSSLGSVGREFSLQLNELTAREFELYEDDSGNSLLATVQNDILELSDPEEVLIQTEPDAANDESIQFHVCHSRMREVQVLHDRLLAMFEQDTELKPGDILVMAPEIEAYEPAVRAVFDSAEPDRFIPWSLADRSMRFEQPLAASFLALLDLLTSRFTAPEVIAFLENDAVLRRFAIAKDQIRLIRNWIRESGIRWGMDAEHREEMGCSMSDLHSWSFGIRRMLLGFMAGGEAEIFAGIVPYTTLSTDESVLLGRLTAFFDRLQQWHTKIQGGKSATEWADLLYGILDDFFDPGKSENDLNTLLALRECVGDWKDNCLSAGVDALSLAVVKSYFSEILAGRSEGHVFLSGRVTFCNMVPMRSVPFLVVWLLGMNDAEYPRNQRPVNFNLISREPRLGDRNRRNDDCYLFLEALISARKIFSVSWVGRDQQDNSVRPPSVVVVTLLDYLQQRGYMRVAENYCPPGMEHPLQPFSPRCFDPDRPTASYAGQWLPAKTGQSSSSFLPSPLPPPEGNWFRLEVEQFVRFWMHPVRYFLNERLGIYPGDREDLVPEKEPFGVDFLERYHFASEMTGDLLQGKNIENKALVLQAAGRLPHGAFGQKFFGDISRDVQDFVAVLTTQTDRPLGNLEVDLMVGQYRFEGWLGSIYENGRIRYRPARLKCTDLLRLWVEHLLYNLVANEDYERTSSYVASDKIVRLQPVADPAVELNRLVELYSRGLLEPLRFYPKTSEACFLALQEEKLFDPGKTWNSRFMYTGEGDDEAYRIALKGIEPFDEPFTELAIAVYEPLYRHMEVEDAQV